MDYCKTCPKDKFIDFSSSECESCSRKKIVIKDVKEIHSHITTLMKECNISFE